MSNVSVGSHGPVWFSVQRSGIVKGITQVSALAADASAVAMAATSAVGTPKNPPISVPTGLLRAMVRNTCTWTRVGCPLGSFGKVTSAGVTDTVAPATRLVRAV